jgi:hypothetical protein
MGKIVRLVIGDKTVILNFNMIFGEQIAKLLKITNPQPEFILKAILELNEKSSFLMYKVIIYCGILGNDYIKGLDASMTQEDVAELILKCNGEQLTEVFETLAKELGFDLNATVEESTKNEKKKK